MHAILLLLYRVSEKKRTFICVSHTEASSVTGRASDDQGLGSPDDTIFAAKCKALQSNELSRLRSELLGV